MRRYSQLFAIFCFVFVSWQLTSFAKEGIERFNDDTCSAIQAQVDICKGDDPPLVACSTLTRYFSAIVTDYKKCRDVGDFYKTYHFIDDSVYIIAKAISKFDADETNTEKLPVYITTKTLRRYLQECNTRSGYALKR